MEIITTHDAEINQIKNEYLEKLKQKRTGMLSSLNALDKLIKDAENSFTIGSPIPLLEKQSESIDLGKLKDANGYDLFLVGLDKIGGEGTVAEVFSLIKNLDLSFIKQKVANNSLRQWLNVSANALHKKGLLEKVKRKDRKGGVMYKRTK